MAEQKQVVLYEKKKLVDEVFAEAEERLSQLKQAAEKTINTVKLEMPEGITQLDLGAVQSQIRVTAPEPGINVVPGTSAGVSSGISASVTSGTVDGITTASDYLGSHDYYARVYEPQIMVKDDDVEIPGVNPLLDESKNFADRYKEAMDKKAYLIATGEHFHNKFDDVLTAVMENSNPYLIGPSGCGKTYMVSQIAKILGMEFIDIGYINEEYDILGFQTANGGYSRPNFYRCYKYGKILCSLPVQLSRLIPLLTYSRDWFYNGRTL